MYQTFKWTHHVSTFCSFVFHKITESTLSCHVLDFIQLLLPMYVTSVMHFFFFRYEMNGTKTLIDELLCVVYPLWRNVVSLGGIVQNLSKKKTEYKCLIRLKSPVQIQVNRRQRFRRRRFVTTLCLRGIQDVKRRIRGELETMARQVLKFCCAK